jgi:hypothetical protein
MKYSQMKESMFDPFISSAKDGVHLIWKNRTGPVMTYNCHITHTRASRELCTLQYNDVILKNI